MFSGMVALADTNWLKKLRRLKPPFRFPVSGFRFLVFEQKSRVISKSR